MRLEGKISRHFTWHDALYLKRWDRLANELDGLDRTVIRNLRAFFAVMDWVREYLNAPITVHCAYRPREYNVLVDGAVHSGHIYGIACDFHVAGMTCDEARKRLEPKLVEFGLRMEKRPGSDWVHLDKKPVPPGGSRYFIP